MDARSTETTAQTSLTREWLQVARYYLGRPRMLVVGGGVAIVAGMVLNWSWLVASGVLPILLTALPCAVMCGLGLCAHKMFGNSSCSTDAQQGNAVTKRTVDTPVLLDGSSATGEASTCCHEGEDRPKSSSRQGLPSTDERRDTHA
jgi:hypothetical protein